MSKRRRFVLTSVVLSVGFVAVQFLNDVNRFWAIGVLALSTCLLFLWSLWASLGKNMTLLTLVLPTIFTLGVGIFWFLLPASIYARIPIVIFFGIGIYVLCLTMNIFSVAAAKTIALLRAARGVGFVLSLLTSFLVFDAIHSLKTEIYFLVPLIFIVSLPLYLQGFWSVLLEKEFSRKTFMMALGSSIVTAEISAALYFWPATVVTSSLFLTVTFYMILGLGQAQIEERLFPVTVRDHFTVGILAFIATFLSTRWGA